MPQSPAYRDVHVDKLLEDISIKYSNGEMVVGQLSPEIPVKKQSDKLVVFGKEYMKWYDTMAEPGVAPRTIYHTYSKKTYYCDKRHLGQIVTDEEVDNADAPIDPDVDATENVTDALILDHEMRGKDVIDAAIYNGGYYDTVSTKWDSAGGGTPDKDIMARAVAMHKRILRTPNTIVIPFKVAAALTTNAAIKEIVKYHVNILNIENLILLPKVLWGMKVVIPGAGYNVNNLGAAEDINYIWGNRVYLLYVNPSPGRKRISFSYTFRWKSRQVKKTRDERAECYYIDIKEWLDLNVVCPECGDYLDLPLATY